MAFCLIGEEKPKRVKVAMKTRKIFIFQLPLHRVPRLSPPHSVFASNNTHPSNSTAQQIWSVWWLTINYRKLDHKGDHLLLQRPCRQKSLQGPIKRLGAYCLSPSDTIIFFVSRLDIVSVNTVQETAGDEAEKVGEHFCRLFTIFPLLFSAREKPVG